MSASDEMIRKVAEAVSMPRSTIALYKTMLQRAELMTDRSAEQNAAIDTARLLIAVVATELPAEAVAMVELFAEMACVAVTPATSTLPFQSDLEDCRLDEAIAKILGCAAAVRANREQGYMWFGLDVRRRGILLSVYPNQLSATLRLGPIACHFERISTAAQDIHPDEWGSLPVKERLLARSMHHGISATRSIAKAEIYIAAGALLDGIKMHPHH